MSLKKFFPALQKLQGPPLQQGVLVNMNSVFSPQKPSAHSLTKNSYLTYYIITRNILDNLLCLLHLLSMTVKQSTHSLTHVLIGFLSIFSWILETFKNLDGLVMEESVYSGGGNKF